MTQKPTVEELLAEFERRQNERFDKLLFERSEIIKQSQDSSSSLASELAALQSDWQSQQDFLAMVRRLVMPDDINSAITTRLIKLESKVSLLLWMTATVATVVISVLVGAVLTGVVL